MDKVCGWRLQKRFEIFVWGRGREVKIEQDD
jgi:hypothetical protein